MNAGKKYLRPVSLEQAVQMVADCESGFRFIAGGTDVMVNKYQGTDTASCLIDLGGIAEMKHISQAGACLQIGALVSLSDLEQNAIVASEFPVLIEAVRSVAAPVIRRTATIGGNVLCENRCAFYNQSEWWREAVGYCLKCNGEICIATGGKGNCFSKFASDMAVALISLGATVRILDRDGEYTLPLENIYTGDGVRPRKLADAALLHSINVPLGRDYRSVFKKLRRRRSLEFSSLTSVVTTDRDGGVRIALGGVDPAPVVVTGAGSDDKNELIRKATKKARIVDNDTFPRLYRKEMIGVYLRQSFEKLGW